MKKFTINCNFGGGVGQFAIYIGVPEKDHHPLHFQSEWLSKEKGGAIPKEIMESLAKLKEIADRNNVSYETLCEYALQAASAPKTPIQSSSKTDETASAPVSPKE